MPPSNDEPVNLLSLDGGGVRGVASLLILHEIMVKIKEIRSLQEIPKPCEYFHMIAGTSTGGLIAIMLGRLRMSTEEALREYDHCAAKVFSFRNKKWTTATEKFRATALREVVQDLVRRRNMGDEMGVMTTPDNKGHCFVCAMPANRVGEPRRLRSFSVDTCDDPELGIKIWEAARATTAASFFFKPMPLRVSAHVTEDYIDAAIGCNNPVEYLLQEAADFIGTGRRLGCVISIGTGTRQVKIGRASTGCLNLLQAPKFLKELIGTLKNTATDGEETHRRVQAKFAAYPNAYFRFNVPDAAAKVKLHHYLKINILKAATMSYLSQPRVAAEILTAASVLERSSSDHGLTLGHLHSIDKDQVVLSTQEVQSLGHTTRFFTGRADILEKMDSCFSERDTGGIPRREFLLYGMAGVGKTQLALKAADDFEKRFKYIFHIDATNPTSTSQSYASICQEQRLGVGTATEMRDLALRWMQGLSDEWLMIYDNFPDDLNFRPTIPGRNKGNIIYTSRSRGFLSHLPPECACEVALMSDEDGLNLLLRAAGRDKSSFDSEEANAAEDLVDELGHLPLAIVEAAAYLRETGCTVVVYLQRFRDMRAARPELLSKPNSDGSFPARPALYNALDLSYDALVSLRRREGRSLLGRAAQGALQLLNLICFYHNESFPALTLKRAAEQRLRWGSAGVCPLDLSDDRYMDATSLLGLEFPEGTWHSELYSLAAAVLERYSLVKLADRGERISMHVMVQAWAQDRMSEETRRRQALAARMMLIESIVLSWSKVDTAYLRKLPPHVNACMAHEAAPTTDDKYQALLDFKLGWYYKEEKQFSSAVKHLSNALRLWKLESGPYSPSATLVLAELGKTYHDMGRLGDAEFTLREKMHTMRMRRLETIADFEEREAREQKRMRKRAERRKTDPLLRLGRSTTHEAGKTRGGGQQAVTNRASTPWWVGKSAAQLAKEIEPFKVKKDRPETDEEYQFELATAWADLGRVLLDQGRASVGRQYLLRAKELMELDNPDVQTDINVWLLEDELKWRFEGGGDINHWVRRSEAVNSLPQDAREDFSLHQCAFIMGVGFAELLVKRGDWEDAYDVYDSLYEDAPRSYGASDRRTLFLMRMMAFCQYKQGLFEDAEELAGTAVERAKSSYGLWHFVTAECLLILFMVKRVLILDSDPGGELWNIAQEAYDSARSVSEDTGRALKIKAWMEEYRERPLREWLFREENFGKYFQTNGYYPESMEDFIHRLTIDFRELNRTRVQAALKKNKGRTPISPQPGGMLDALLSPYADGAPEVGGVGAGVENAGLTGCIQGREGDGKANDASSPVHEEESSFHDGVVEESGSTVQEAGEEAKHSGVEGGSETSPIPAAETDLGSGKEETRRECDDHSDRGSQETLLEKHGNGSPGRSSLTTSGTNMGAIEKGWMRLRRAKRAENDATVTGAFGGEAKVHRRRISAWIPLDRLVKPAGQSHIGQQVVGKLVVLGV